jgi:hypothetical protein
VTATTVVGIAFSATGVGVGSPGVMVMVVSMVVHATSVTVS